MKLLDLQRRMAADLMRPLTRNDSLSPKVNAAEYIAPNDRLSARERLQIYSRSYWYRILDSFHDDFPGLRAILGAQAFHRLARAYLADNPSRSFTLRNLGSALSAWLPPRRRYTAGRHALALDMVRLEWAHIEAFDSPAATPLGPEDLLELDAGLRMRLQPYITLLQVHYAVDDLRIGVTRNKFLHEELHNAASNAVQAPRHRASKTKSVPRQRAPIFLAVHRYRNSVYYRRLEPEAYRILTALGRGEPIGAALEAGYAGSALTADEYQAAIAKWFARWAELGWLCRYANVH